MAGPESISEEGSSCRERKRLEDLVENHDQLTASFYFGFFVSLSVVDEGHEYEGN